MSWGERSCKYCNSGECPVPGGPQISNCNVNCHAYINLPNIPLDSAPNTWKKEKTLERQRDQDLLIHLAKRYEAEKLTHLEYEKERMTEKYRPNPMGSRKERRAAKARLRKNK